MPSNVSGYKSSISLLHCRTSLLIRFGKNVCRAGFSPLRFINSVYFSCSQIAKITQQSWSIICMQRSTCGSQATPTARHTHTHTHICLCVCCICVALTNRQLDFHWNLIVFGRIAKQRFNSYQPLSVPARLRCILSDSALGACAAY